MIQITVRKQGCLIRVALAHASFGLNSEPTHIASSTRGMADGENSLSQMGIDNKSPKSGDADLPTRAVSTKTANKPFLAYVRIFPRGGEANVSMNPKDIKNTVQNEKLYTLLGKKRRGTVMKRSSEAKQWVLLNQIPRPIKKWDCLGYSSSYCIWSYASPSLVNSSPTASRGGTKANGSK